MPAAAAQALSGVRQAGLGTAAVVRSDAECACRPPRASRQPVEGRAGQRDRGQICDWVRRQLR